MKVLFTEKYIKELKPQLNDARFEVTDERCPYLRCRVGSQSKSYIVAKKSGGKLVRITLGKASEISLDYARKAAYECLRQLKEGVNPNEEKQKVKSELSLGDLFQEYVERYASSQTSKQTLKENKSIFQRRFDKWADLRISEISTRKIQEKIDEVYKTSGTSAANKALTLLRHIYNKAIQWGWEGRNPTLGISKYKLQSRERFLHPDEFKRFFDVLDEEENPNYRVFFYTLLYTGQRRGNVMEMRWENIDFRTSTWYIPKTKNGTSMTVPIVPQLAEKLKELRGVNPVSPWVFPMADDFSRHMAQPQKAWNRLKQKAEILNLRMHDLRRTVGSYQCMNGVNLSVVSKTLNHKTLQATQVYARVDVSAVNEALQTTVNQFESFR